MLATTSLGTPRISRSACHTLSTSAAFTCSAEAACREELVSATCVYPLAAGLQLGATRASTSSTEARTMTEMHLSRK